MNKYIYIFVYPPAVHPDTIRKETSDLRALQPNSVASFGIAAAGAAMTRAAPASAIALKGSDLEGLSGLGFRV